MAAGAVDGVEIAAVYSRNAATAEHFAAKHGIPSCYTDYTEMLLSDINAVYIASPIFMHLSQAEEAIARGKHVLCEKMMTADYHSAMKLSRLASGRVTLLEAMRPDFDPAFSLIREWLPAIGRVCRAEFEFCQYSSRYDRFKEGEVLNAFDPRIGNSALSDIGIYPLHMLISLFGAPEAVNARATLLQNGFEGEGELSLSYPHMTASAVYSKIRGSERPSVIYGERGEIGVDKISAPTRVWLRTNDGRTVKDVALPTSDTPGYNMRYEIAAFAEMVEGRIDNAPYLYATLESIRIVDLAYRQTGAYRFMTEIEAYK